MNHEQHNIDDEFAANSDESDAEQELQEPEVRHRHVTVKHENSVNAGVWLEGPRGSVGFTVRYDGSREVWSVSDPSTSASPVHWNEMSAPAFASFAELTAHYGDVVDVDAEAVYDGLMDALDGEREPEPELAEADEAGDER